MNINKAMQKAESIAKDLLDKSLNATGMFKGVIDPVRYELLSLEVIIYFVVRVDALFVRQHVDEKIRDAFLNKVWGIVIPGFIKLFDEESVGEATNARMNDYAQILRDATIVDDLKRLKKMQTTFIQGLQHSSIASEPVRESIHELPILVDGISDEIEITTTVHAIEKTMLVTFEHQVGKLLRKM